MNEPMTPKEARNELETELKAWLDEAGIPYRGSFTGGRAIRIDADEPENTKRTVFDVARKHGYDVTKWDAKHIHFAMETGLKHGLYECNECEYHYTQSPNQSNECPSCGSMRYASL